MVDKETNEAYVRLAMALNIRHIIVDGIVYYCAVDVNSMFNFNSNNTRFRADLLDNEKYMSKERARVLYITVSAFLRQLKKKIDSGSAEQADIDIYEEVSKTTPSEIQTYVTSIAGPMSVWERKDWLTNIAPKEYVNFLSGFKMIPYNTLRTMVPTQSGLPLDAESPIDFHMRSTIPFVDFHTLRQIYTTFMSEYLFCYLYDKNRRILLNCQPGFVTQYEEELRDELIRFELRHEFEPISIYFPSVADPKVIKCQRIVFLTKNNLRVYGTGSSMDCFTEYIQKNQNKFLKTEHYVQKVTPKYYYDETEFDIHLHEDIFVPYDRLCPDLQAFVTKRGMSGLHFQVSPDDYARCLIKEWHMEKRNEIIFVFYKDGKKKVYAQYYIMERLISAFPEERFLITPSMHYTNLCRDFLVINRLQTTHVDSTNQRALSESELNNNFRYLSVLKYDALITLFDDHVVVNGCGEFVPDYPTRGPWRMLKLGADWIKEKDYAAVGIRERYNLFPNNDVKPKIVMEELEQAVLNPVQIIPSYVQVGGYTGSQMQLT